MKTPSRYDLQLFTIAIITWGYAFSWIFARRFWSVIIDVLHPSPAMLSAFFGTSVILTCVVSISAVVIHGNTMLSVPKRERRRPRILGHISAFALLWVGIGSAIIIVERPFPYSENTQNINESVEHEARRDAV